MSGDHDQKMVQGALDNEDKRISLSKSIRGLEIRLTSIIPVIGKESESGGLSHGHIPTARFARLELWG